MSGGNLPAPAEAAAQEEMVALLAASAWRYMLVHHYADARLVYAFLHHLQPREANWSLGGALTAIQCGEPDAAQVILSGLADNPFSPAQRRAFERLAVLSKMENPNVGSA